MFAYDNRFKGKIMQYANEHFFQRSATTASSAGRATYSTAEQTSMRLRFLMAKGDTQMSPEVEKERVPLEEPGLTQEQIEARRAAEEGYKIRAWRLSSHPSNNRLPVFCDFGRLERKLSYRTRIACATEDDARTVPRIIAAGRTDKRLYKQRGKC